MWNLREFHAIMSIIFEPESYAFPFQEGVHRPAIR
jgi:hypothetical protein